MNIQLFNQEPTMTSREIADLVQARHDNVKKAIDRCVEKGAFDIPQIQGYLDSLGRAGQTEFILGKRESLIVVAQMCPEFTGRIIDRWQELESKQIAAVQLPQDYLSALKALTAEVEARQTLQLELQAAKPALEFVDKYVDSTGLKGFRQVAKLLKIKEPDLRAFLDDKQIMYKLAGEWVPYACHIDAGRFAVKAGTADNGHAFNSAKFTPKGIKWLAGEIAKSKVE